VVFGAEFNSEEAHEKRTNVEYRKDKEHRYQNNIADAWTLFIL
jgi:hypothetical protein